jgi:UDP-N-acetylmuramoyl-L-alanyl-D-glutamate--2,6-diaminopimelate ligase
MHPCIGVIAPTLFQELEIEQAIKMAKKDDIVIIAGKGHENYQIIGKVKHHFDDKEIAQEFLNNK